MNSIIPARKTTLYVGISLLGPLTSWQRVKLSPRRYLQQFMTGIADYDIDLSLFVPMMERDAERLLFPLRRVLYANRMHYETNNTIDFGAYLHNVCDADGGRRERCLFITSEVLQTTIPQQTLVCEMGRELTEQARHLGLSAIDTKDYGILRHPGYTRVPPEQDVLLLAMKDMVVELANTPDVAVEDFLAVHDRLAHVVAPMFGRVQFLSMCNCLDYAEKGRALPHRLTAPSKPSPSTENATTPL